MKKQTERVLYMRICSAISFSFNSDPHSPFFLMPYAYFHETISRYSIIWSITDGSPLQKVLYNVSKWSIFSGEISNSDTKLRRPQSRCTALLQQTAKWSRTQMFFLIPSIQTLAQGCNSKQSIVQVQNILPKVKWDMGCCSCKIHTWGLKYISVHVQRHSCFINPDKVNEKVPKALKAVPCITVKC